MPDQYVAKKIGSALKEYESIDNLRILIARAQVADPELPKHLELLGGIVDDIPFYKTVPETEDRNGAVARLAESGADWITFTSSSTVENFHARFPLPELLRQFPGLRLASIGPETSKTIAALGLAPAFEAKPHTIDGLVRGLLAAASSSARP
jgi:uroporphyrinogen III methyltransferase/synthase